MPLISWQTRAKALPKAAVWAASAGVLCQPYRAEEGTHDVSVFFRDTQLSDAIGFEYCGYADYEQAAQEFLHQIKQRFARQVSGDEDRVLTVILDGENASAPGVDLGTWIGEEEENRAWELLGQARDLISRVGATPATAPDVFQALYVAEGSDWFWWFGADQDSGHDGEFDDLFRTHLKNIYRGLGVEPPADLDRHIVPHTVAWTLAQQVSSIQRGDRLTVRSNCPGVLTWRLGDGAPETAEMIPVGGVMAGVRRYHLILSPFPERTDEIHLRFRCTCPGCSCQDSCCRPGERVVQVV